MGSMAPTAAPTMSPTLAPTRAPIVAPTAAPTAVPTPDRLHQECWQNGGCTDHGATACDYCGIHNGYRMHCCRKDGSYGEGHNCHEANFAKVDDSQHRCVTPAEDASGAFAMKAWAAVVAMALAV